MKKLKNRDVLSVEQQKRLQEMWIKLQMKQKQEKKMLNENNNKIINNK